MTDEPFMYTDISERKLLEWIPDRVTDTLRPTANDGTDA